MPVTTVDWPNVLGFAVIALIFSHLFMRTIRDDRRLHQAAMYVATAFGGLALWTGTYDSRSKFAVWQLPGLEQDRLWQLRMLKERIQSYRDYNCTYKEERTADSPPTFDQWQAELREACAIINAISLRSKEWANAETRFDLPELTNQHFEIEETSFMMSDLQLHLASYNKVVGAIEELKQDADPTPFRATLALAGPYLFAGAFSLALAGIAYPAIPPSPQGTKPKRQRRRSDRTGRDNP